MNFTTGIKALHPPIETDAVIIGAGPVGLFQVFELGLLEVKAHVIDSLPNIGGQCVELYRDKPIYDIPAIPVCTGQELTDRLLKQIAPFGAQFHLDQEVNAMERMADGRFHIGTSAGGKFISRTLFIAAGVGAFQARTLKIDGIDAFAGTQLFYRNPNPDQFDGKDIVVCGGGDQALEWAIHYVGKARRIVLVHRRDQFKAAPASIEKIQTLCANQKLQLVTGQLTGFKIRDERLTEIEITGNTGEVAYIPLDALLVFLGLSPKLGPISNWGLDLDRKQIAVDTEKFESSVPGIFAVGDINTYPGKKKLILSGFHEATLAAFGSMRYIFPEKPVHLQYTTTSPKLQKALGVYKPIND